MSSDEALRAYLLARQEALEMADPDRQDAAFALWEVIDAADILMKQMWDGGPQPNWERVWEGVYGS